MARSFSIAKFLSALVVDGFSTAIARRGYAAGSQGVAATVVRGGGGGGGGSPAGGRTVTGGKNSEVGSTVKSSWVPDPKTGFYGPENGAVEIDAAELRAALLKKP